MRAFLPPILWIFGYQAISYGIGVITRDNMNWYHALEKSALTPPDIVFPIVWTALYVMLALAGWQLWTKRKDENMQTAFILYWTQMVLNWAWSFVFFEFHMIATGFFWIAALNILMLGFIAAAWRKARYAALLVLPTVLWGCFAAYLNYAIWMMN